MSLRKIILNYDVYIHNNIIDKIYNTRNNAGEINIEINNDDYKLFKLMPSVILYHN